MYSSYAIQRLHIECIFEKFFEFCINIDLKNGTGWDNSRPRYIMEQSLLLLLLLQILADFISIFRWKLAKQKFDANMWKIKTVITQKVYQIFVYNIHRMKTLPREFSSENFRYFGPLDELTWFIYYFSRFVTVPVQIKGISYTSPSSYIRVVSK